MTMSINTRQEHAHMWLHIAIYCALVRTGAECNSGLNTLHIQIFFNCGNNGPLYDTYRTRLCCTQVKTQKKHQSSMCTTKSHNTRYDTTRRGRTHLTTNVPRERLAVEADAVVRLEDAIVGDDLQRNTNRKQNTT